MLSNSDIIDDLQEDNEAITDKIITSAILPSSLPVLALSVIAMFTVMPLELMIGSVKTLIGLSVSIIVDLSIRFILWGFCGFHLNETGPLSALFYFCLLYFLMFPNVNSSFIHVKEKYILALILVALSFLGQLTSLIALGSSFLTFIFIAPLVLPQPNKVKVE